MVCIIIGMSSSANKEILILFQWLNSKLKCIIDIKKRGYIAFPFALKKANRGIGTHS